MCWGQRRVQYDLLGKGDAVVDRELVGVGWWCGRDLVRPTPLMWFAGLAPQAAASHSLLLPTTRRALAIDRLCALSQIRM